MGHDIGIYKMSGDKLISKRVQTTYLSYFSINGCVCLTHLQNNYKFCKTRKCNLKHIWFVNDDCSGLIGTEIEKTSERALNVLSSIGVVPGNSDSLINTKGINIEHKKMQDLCASADRILFFQKLGQRYNDCMFISDCCDDRDHVTFVEPPPNFLRDDFLTTPVAYFNHPTKGLLGVASFRDAMEAFGVLRSIDERRAEWWFKLAGDFHPMIKEHLSYI